MADSGTPDQRRQALAQQLLDAGAVLACVITRSGQGRLELIEGLDMADAATLLHGFADSIAARQPRKVARTVVRRRRGRG